MNWHEHIISDENILLGKPTIKGTRLSVEFIIGRLADGWSEQMLLENYPSLTSEGLRVVFFYIQGGHNEGFPDTSKQLFKEVYEAVAAGKQPENPSYPTFADGYRELLICEKILESNKKQGWVEV